MSLDHWSRLSDSYSGVAWNERLLGAIDGSFLAFRNSRFLAFRNSRFGALRNSSSLIRAGERVAFRVALLERLPGAIDASILAFRFSAFRNSRSAFRNSSSLVQAAEHVDVVLTAGIAS